MHKLNDYIEEKKIKSSKTPRYGMKKLAVGLVSCILGYTVLVSPGVVHAEEVREPQAVVMEAEEEKEEEKEEAVLPEEKEEAEEEAEEQAETGETEEIEEEKEALKAEEATEEKTEETAEEVNLLSIQNKEEVTEEEVADEEKTEEVEESAEKKVTEEDEKDGINIEDAELVSNVLGVTGDETEGEIEVGKEAEPEPLTADGTSEETREAKDISNEVINKHVALTEEGHETKGTIKPDAGESIGWEISFTSPKGTIAGDYFTIDLSDNLSLKGIEPDHKNEYPIEIDGSVVADGVRLDRSTIKYTFNDNIKDQRNVRVSVKGFAYIDKTKVPNNTPEEKISIKVGDTVDEHNINVEYGKPYYTGENLNGMSQFTEFNPETGEYTQVFYINPDSKIIGTSTSDDWSANKVAVFIDGVDPETGSQSDVKYTEDNTKITIHKLKSGEKLPAAIIENPAVNYDDPIYRYKFRDNGIELIFADQNDDKLPSDFIGDPYVVIVKSTAAPSQTGNNIISKGILYGGARQHTMYNDIVTTVGDTEAQGEKIGSFQEHHVYYTKVDNVLQEDKTFTLHSNKTEGYDYDTYFTNKNEIDDFKFVKVDTEKLVENPVYNEDGTIARGNYEPGKTKEVTYIYERDITSGKFQEHHIYQTVDEDDKVISTDETVNKDETKGIDEDSYKTSKIDRDGYTLTEVKATNDESSNLGVQFNSNGAEATGNYVNGKKLEVTYVYQKRVITKGKFIEHHIYQTVDEDGEVISTDDTVDKDPTTGKESEKYTTAKEDRDGYKLTSVEGKENASFNKDGSQAEGNYVKDKTQEVTYTYQKKEITKGSFQEHHIYITKDETGKEISKTTKDGDLKVGKKDQTYTTSKIEKDGFTLVRTETPVEEPTYNQDGSEATGKYKPGVKQEITYVYEKIEKKPEKPNTPDPTPEKPEEPTPTPVIHEEEKPNPTPTPRHEDPTPTPEETPVEEPKEDPAPKQEEEKPEPKEEPKTEEPKEEETPEETPVEEAKEEEKEVVIEKEEDDEADRSKDTTHKHEGKEDYSKAPQTGVAGAAGYLGLAGLGTALLAALEDKKKKKNK